jgi:acyl carrier protein phosphodiesterase
MNFLAHIFLSGPPGEVMVGNFMADSVRGNMVKKYSPEIQQGIKMHRAIDTFTDAHDVVLKSKERLRSHFGKYAPVVADVYYDHFLALHWKDFSEISLKQYTNEIYTFLEKHYSVFPERTKRFYEYMVKYDILFSYSKIEGIDRVMKGMSRRARFESGMERAADELVSNYESYKSEFHLFFPEIQQHIRNLAP